MTRHPEHALPSTRRIRRRLDLWRFTKRLDPAGSNFVPVTSFRRALTTWLETAAGGRVRVVVLRGRHAVAAVVSLEDYWFLRRLEEALVSLGWRPGAPRISPESIAKAVMHLSRDETV
jgi:hypothetical protein